ncbi:hypothetical protein WJM97_12225 [Okeanomitos corallinicola TIOX110]|uniref:Uncharacterized protein n=1 Tax=Okeanomitos corallinicola TIOX110 TaxID=3133117 RepID=A0ABZ2ULC6_9CYAN
MREYDDIVHELEQVKKQLINNQKQLLDIYDELFIKKKLESTISFAILRASIALFFIGLFFSFFISLLFRR